MLSDEAIIKWNSTKPGVLHKVVMQRSCFTEHILMATSQTLTQNLQQL